MGNKTIKITEDQAKMLKEMNKHKVIKVTQEQYNKIIEIEKGISEKSLSPMGNSMVKQAPGPLRPELGRQMKNINPYKLEEIYESFLHELYGLTENDPVLGESKFKKLHKLMELSGLIKGNRLVKEKFGDDKEIVKQVISVGLYEMACGGSSYRAMEAIEEALKLKDITPDYFRKQIGEPKKSGKSKEELMGAIKKQREKSHAITAAREKEREDTERQGALEALADGMKKDQKEIDKGEEKEMEEHNYKHGDYVGDSEPKHVPKVYNVLLKIDSDLALMEKGGELYVFKLPDESEFHDPEYVSAPGEAEHSEDGWNTIYDYEDVDIDEDAIELYVNDNFNELRDGQGFNAYDSGEYDIIKLDDEIKADLLGLANYITPRKAEELQNILTMDEGSTTFSVGGAYTPLFGAQARYESNLEEEEALTEEGIGSVGVYDTNAFNDAELKDGNEKGKGPTHKKPMRPGYKFVNIKDKCKKFPYCNQGTDAISVGENIISNDHIVQEVAKKTGRTIEDVKKIISNFN